MIFSIDNVTEKILGKTYPYPKIILIWHDPLGFKNPLVVTPWAELTHELDVFNWYLYAAVHQIRFKIKKFNIYQ